MMWKDILLTVISVTLPLLVTWGLNMLSKYISAKTENEKISGVLSRVNDIISAVVAETTQTFVDSLKAKKKWDAMAAKDALDMSKDKAIQLIDKNAQELIQGYTGDFNTWLTAKIEQAVKENK